MELQRANFDLIIDEFVRQREAINDPPTMREIALLKLFLHFILDMGG